MALLRTSAATCGESAYAACASAMHFATFFCIFVSGPSGLYRTIAASPVPSSQNRCSSMCSTMSSPATLVLVDELCCRKASVCGGIGGSLAAVKRPLETRSSAMPSTLGLGRREAPSGVGLHQTPDEVLRLVADARPRERAHVDAVGLAIHLGEPRHQHYVQEGAGAPEVGRRAILHLAALGIGLHLGSDVAGGADEREGGAAALGGT
eukprot:scaffold4342_cov234-Pinguiococcus_pyrenoidosus.AAC.8